MDLSNMTKEELELLKVEVNNNPKRLKRRNQGKVEKFVVYYDRFATNFVSDSSPKIIAKTYEKLF